MAIKNIIFDLGVVIIDVDAGKTIGAFKNLGVKNFDAYYTLKKQQHFFDEFEKGYLSEEKFRNAIREAADIALSDLQIDNAWNAMLGEVPLQRFAFLLYLQKEYNLFLLSNTNLIHWKAFIKYFDTNYGEGKFEDLFHGVYYSFEAGMRKPDADFFNLVLEENNMEPNETLFIDDNEQNIFGAEVLGIKSHLHLPETNIEDYVLDLISELK